MFTDVETIGGHDVSATADFQMTDGTLTLTLNNITAQTSDAGQLFTGIRFTLANGNSVITSAGLTATGLERTVLDDGTYSDSGPKALSWELKPGAAMQVDFQPDARDGIIGPANGESASTEGIYVANGSILGNSGHNPFAAESAVFTLSSPEFLSTTDVTNVTFFWGTSLDPGLTLSSAAAAVPEPASIGVLGCVAVVLLRRRQNG
jgi:hypothetical protein